MISLPTEAVIAPKPKRTMLPVLIILFLLSYGLMSTLVVEQARTIDSQRGLIIDLFSDSSELTALKGKLVQQKNRLAMQQPPAGSKSHAGSAAPSQSAPQGKAQDKANQNSKQEKSMADKGKTARKAAPEKPPKYDSVMDDERRITVQI